MNRVQCHLCGYWFLPTEKCKCQKITGEAFKNTLGGAHLTPETLQGFNEKRSALHRQVAGIHYRELAIQPAEFATKNNLGFLAGCVVKRVCRYRQKGGKEDLEKAIHELQLLIELEYPDGRA